MSDELDVELDDEEPVDEEAKQHFNKYLISERIDFHLTSNAPEVDAAVDYLCKGVGYTGDYAVRHMRMLICNLYRNYDNWRRRYTHLCMSKGDGKMKLLRQYNHFRITYDPLCKCITYLIMNRYIRRKKGYWNAKFEDGYETRLIARGKLIRLLEGRFRVRSHMIHPYPDQQTIIVRKTIREKEVTFTRADGFVRRYRVKIKRPVEYEESTNIKGCRANLKRYNQLLARNFVDIDLAGLEPGECRDEIIDLSKKWVRRIFTETMRRGGRFYGGWWQQIRKQLRSRIIINGRHTTEIDFAGLHIHILYALQDKLLGDKEPYIVPKDNDPENKRPLYKRLMLAGVNARTDVGCIRAVIDEVKSNPQDYPPVTVSYTKFYYRLKVMLKELQEHHVEIVKDINSGKGLKAQYIDSEIAYKVITKMTNKGIPVLCIHDSFICRDMDASEVKQAMLVAYVDVITRETIRRKCAIKLTEQDVKSTMESIIETMDEYKHVHKDEVLHALNPVFRQSSSYYKRYIEYLASSRTKCTFNITINLTKEIIEYKGQNTKHTNGVTKYGTIQEYCRATLLEDVLRYRESVSNEVCGAGTLLETGLTTYLGGFRPPGQCLSGFAKLHKISGTAPWLSATGSQKQKPDDIARKFLHLKRGRRHSR
jgi:hypothetical protein